MKRQLLLFNIPSQHKAAIEQLCATLGILTKEVGLQDFGTPMGRLCGIEDMMLPPPTAPIVPFADPMLFFVNFDDQALRSFLGQYNGAGIPKVNLKAGLTQYNVAWTPMALHKELTEEHQQMSGAN